MSERLITNKNGHTSEVTGGVLITDPRDQRKVQPVITDYAEKAKDWPYAEQVKFLNRWAGIFKERLLDPVAVPGKPALPDPVIGFEGMRVETLAAYTLNRNNHGLLYEINFNTVHMLDTENGKQWRYGQWGELETLLHEMIHLWQQNAGEHPYKKGSNTHNAEFVAKCEYFGLHPMPVVGCHIAPADGLFAQIMKEHGIQRPEGEMREGGNENWWSLFPDMFTAPPKGRSSLTKWACPECGFAVNATTRKDISLICGECKTETGQDIFFVRSERRRPNSHQLKPKK